jgi:hypothetical protein
LTRDGTAIAAELAAGVGVFVTPHQPWTEPGLFDVGRAHGADVSR